VIIEEGEGANSRKKVSLFLSRLGSMRGRERKKKREKEDGGRRDLKYPHERKFEWGSGTY